MVDGMVDFSGAFLEVGLLLEAFDPIEQVWTKRIGKNLGIRQTPSTL